MLTTRRRFAILAACGILVAALALPFPAAADGETCPKCGAPRKPGASFCSACGQKFAAAAPAAPTAPRRSIVQLVAAYDSELTSTFGSINYGENLRVDSIVGSAFAVAPGEFVTDSGLLVGARDVNLRTPSGRTVPAQVVGTDPMIGIALLKAEVEEMTPLELRREPPARMGEGLSALGYASGSQARGEPVVSQGVVSGLHRGAEGIHPIEDYLQSDASLPRGFAGGPMLDNNGKVIGMSTAYVFGDEVVLGRQSGIGFAVPAEWIDRGLTWIRAGSPARGWAGALAVPGNPENRERYHLPSETRLVIEHVFPGSPAAAAGLKRGDGLVEVAGEPVTALPKVHERLLKVQPGEKVALGVARAAEKLKIEVTLAARPERPRLSAIDALRYFASLEVEPRGEDLVVGAVQKGTRPASSKVSSGDVLKSVLSKKDWEHGATDNSRWRSVKTIAELEDRLATAYSDLDFWVGLRFKSKEGTKREMYVWQILSPTAAF